MVRFANEQLKHKMNSPNDTVTNLSETPLVFLMAQGSPRKSLRTARAWRLRCIVASLYLLAGLLTASAQTFRVNSAEVTNGLLKIRFSGRTDSYYFLLSAPSLSVSQMPMAAMLGTNGSEIFTDSVVGAA